MFSALEPGDWKMPMPTAGLVVQQRAQRIFRRAEFDAGNVAQAGDFAVLTRFDDDVAELLFAIKAGLVR